MFADSHGHAPCMESVERIDELVDWSEERTKRGKNPRRSTVEGRSIDQAGRFSGYVPHASYLVRVGYFSATWNVD